MKAMSVTVSATPKTMVTIRPERVRWLSRRIHGAASLPTAGKQIRPVAQETTVASVELQLNVLPADTEQAVVGLMDVVEHMSDVVLVVSRAFKVAGAVVGVIAETSAAEASTAMIVKRMVMAELEEAEQVAE